MSTMVQGLLALLGVLAGAFFTTSPGHAVEVCRHDVFLGQPALRLVVDTLDADAVPDAAVIVGPDGTDASLLTLRGLGDGSLQVDTLMHLAQFGYGEVPSLVAEHLDGDGILDLALTGVVEQILLGDGDLAYESSGLFPTAGGEQLDLDFTDLDGDGDLDSALLVYDIFELFIDTGINSGAGGFGGTGFVCAQGSYLPEGRLLFADVDGDGPEELFITGGTGLVQAPTTSCLPTPPLVEGRFPDLLAADLDGDGFLDLAAAEPDRDAVFVLMNDGTGHFPSFERTRVGPGPETLACGDVTGDGLPDLVLAPRGNDTVTLCAGDGQGGFTPVQRIPVAADPVDLALSDLDGDGDLDIVVAGHASATLTLLLNGPGPCALVHPTR